MPTDYFARYRVVHSIRMIAVPVCAVRQRAVVPQQDDTFSAKMCSKLNGPLPGVEWPAVLWTEEFHTEPDACPLALCPEFGVGFQRAVVMIPPGKISSVDVLAIWDRHPT